MSKAAWKYSKALRVCHLYDRFKHGRRVSMSRWNEQTPWNIHLKAKTILVFHISLACQCDSRFRIFAIIRVVSLLLFTRAATIYLLIGTSRRLDSWMSRYIGQIFFQLRGDLICLILTAQFHSIHSELTRQSHLLSWNRALVCWVELIFKILQFHRIVIFYNNNNIYESIWVEINLKTRIEARYWIKN